MNVEYGPAFPRIFITFGGPGGPGAGAEAITGGNIGAGGDDWAGGSEAGAEDWAGGIGAIAGAWAKLQVNWNKKKKKKSKNDTML